MVNFTLKQCSYFLAVVDHGGIAQAARSLNISQPAVSQALDKLEDLYAFRLFDRHHARGLTVTPEGRSFAAFCRSLIDNAQTVENKAKSIAAHLAGTIRFGCFHTIAPFYLSLLVKQYRSEYPQVDIVPVELMQDELAAQLEAESLDIALTYDMGLDSGQLDLLEVERLKPFVLLAAGHPMAKRGSVSLTELADEPFVMFEGASSRDYFKGILDRHGIDPPIACSSYSMESVRCAVANGLGFSVSVMRPGNPMTYDGGQVASVSIEDDVDPISLVLATKKMPETSRLIDDFAAFCLNQCRAPQQTDRHAPKK